MSTEEKPNGSGQPDQKIKYFFFLDGEKIDWAVSSITGADVRSKLSPEKAGYAIYLESHGKDPDQQITDATTFSIEKPPQPHFYSVPPANFGLT